MVMAEHVVITCDRMVKGKPCGEPATTYCVTRGRESWDVDLCDKHTFWDQVMAEGRAHKPPPGRRTDARAVRPWTPDRL